MDTIFDDLVQAEAKYDASTIFDDLSESTQPAPFVPPSVPTGAYGTRFRPSLTSAVTPPPDPNRPPEIRPLTIPESIASGLQQLPVVGRAFTPTKLPFEVEAEKGQGEPQSISNAIRDVLAGVLKPESIALLATGAGEAQIAKLSPALATAVRRAVSAYFAKQGFEGAVEGSKEMVAPGKTLSERAGSGIEAMAGAGIGALGTAGAVLPSVPGVSPETPSNIPRGTEPIVLPKAPPLTGEAREFQLLRENWLPTIKPWRRGLLDEEVAKGQGTDNIETNFQDSPGARDVTRAKRYYELARKLFGRTGEEVAPTEPTPKLPPEESPPAVAPGEAQQPTPSVGEAKAGAVAPVPAEPSVDQGATPEPPKQVASVTGTVAEKQTQPSGPQMGAAGYGEVEPTGTGLKHAVDEMERAGLGLKDAPERETVNMAQSWQRSAATLQGDPAFPEKIVGELLQNPDRGLSGDESMVLLRYKRGLLDSINDAAEKTHVGDKAARETAQKTHAELTAKLGNFLDAIHSRGSSAGLEFRMRQALVQDDYTFTSRDEFNRFARANTGKDLTPEQGAAAEKVAARVKSRTDAEKDAIDAANKTVRENAIRIANEETKGQVADVVRRQQELAVQEKATSDALKAADKAVKQAVEVRKQAEEKARMAASKSERAAAIVQIKAAEKAVKAADELHRKAAIANAKSQREALGNPLKRVWEKVKEYLDKGETDFREVSSKVATDLGMSVDNVRRTMAQNQRAKFQMDEAWRKQQEAQRFKDEARRWVLGVETPEFEKIFMGIPRGMFGLKVFGHGLVPLGTHAPAVAFQPNYWSVYFPAYKKMVKMVFNKAYYQDQVDALQRRPNYVPAQRGGLINNPQVYEDYTNPDIVKFIAGANAGTRGFTILKILRQDMFDKDWNRLPRSLQTSEMATAISKAINHDTGVANIPGGSKYYAIGLFAPRLEASRVMTLLGDPLRAANTFRRAMFKGTPLGGYVSPADWHFAVNQVKSKAYIFATMYGLLKANQEILDAVGSDQKVNMDDPFRSDFLKFKVHGMNFSYGNAMISMAKLPVELIRVLINDRKTKNLIYDDESFYTILGRFVRTQASPFAGTATDLLLGSDYASRPLPRKIFGFAPQNRPVPKRLSAQGYEQYTWPEYLTQQLAPIPAAEAIKEVWRSGFGLTDEQVKSMGKALVISSVMGATGGRLTPDYELEKPQPLK